MNTIKYKEDTGTEARESGLLKKIVNKSKK